MKIVDYVDFRGGYSTDVPSELMADNELLLAQNCQWRNGIIKRNGIVTYSTTDLSSFAGMKGGIRAYVNGAWYTIIALDNGSEVNFYYGTGTTFTAIDNDFDWTTGKNVELAALNGYVVAVNGTDKPAVIYYSSGWVIENLETLDTRERDPINWYAGQWDNDGDPTSFIDDTDDAADTDADDFQLGNDINNDGIYISCDYTFNKVVFSSCEQAAGSPVAEYAYWNGSSWTTITPTTAPTWTAAAGDRTLEFDIPLNSDGELLWETYATSETTDGVQYRFLLRIRFTTAATAAFSCDSIALYHTQYLTQIMENARPHAVCVHNNQLFLAERNIINMSPPGKVTDWRAGQSEYFSEGGDSIMSMVPYNDTLVVLKENTVYTFNVSNLLSPVRSMPLSSVGTISGRSPAVVNDVLAFVGRDGIYLWDGSKAIKVSSHIQTDIDAYTLSNSAGISYQGEYWICFPSNSIVLSFDPDTYRRDSMGSGRVSFFKFTGYKLHEWIYNNGSEDNLYLLGLVDQASPYVARCDNGATDNVTGTATAITMTIQSRYYNLGSFQKFYYLGRIKPKIRQVSSSAGAAHTLTLLSEDGTVSVDVSITITVGSGYYSEDISIPYTLDGKNISVKMTHALATSAGLIGYSFSFAERRF